MVWWGGRGRAQPPPRSSLRGAAPKRAAVATPPRDSRLPGVGAANAAMPALQLSRTVAGSSQGLRRGGGGAHRAGLSLCPRASHRRSLAHPVFARRDADRVRVQGHDSRNLGRDHAGRDTGRDGGRDVAGRAGSDPRPLRTPRRGLIRGVVPRRQVAPLMRQRPEYPPVGPQGGEPPSDVFPAHGTGDGAGVAARGDAFRVRGIRQAHLHLERPVPGAGGGAAGGAHH
mmetsp:Transcript_60781/g.143978  ORF Transcript_60781/g.143978 Transcript_60781/m.143978 type:complete len:228 (+) Transcript_60781:331-1014(+)